MDIKEYISSGIVETYVLGLASPEEAAEFEQMCVAHHEVRAARDAFEIQLEQAAIANGAAPPRNLKSQIFSEIEIESEKNSPPRISNQQEIIQKAPVIHGGWWKYVAAASVILLIGSTILNFYFFNQYKNISSDYARLVEDQTRVADNYKAQLTSLQNSMDIIRDTNMAVVKMKGVPANPNNMATVYWNKKSKDVYLLVNNLPKPQAGKQYQLWAIVDGTPVDAGMLKWEDGVAVSQMKNIPAAQAFAITLEKEGGSATPSPDMYVVGAVSP